MNLPNLILQAHAAVDVSAFAKVVDPIITNIVYPILELMFGVAVLYFVWGVLQLVIHGDDEDARKKGKSTIVWGTVGMAIMVCAWGIVYVVSNTETAFDQNQQNSNQQMNLNP